MKKSLDKVKNVCYNKDKIKEVRQELTKVKKGCDQTQERGKK